MNPKKHPSRRQVLAARAVQIRGAAKPLRWQSDALFRRLPGLGNYKLDDKRWYCRRVYTAAFTARSGDGVIWTELHHSKTSKSDRRVLDAFVNSGRLVEFKGRDGRCTRFVVAETLRAELEAYRPRSPRRDTVSVEQFTRRKKVHITRPVKIKKGKYCGTIRNARCTKTISPKRKDFDRSDPTYLETRKRLREINAFNARHQFRCEKWCILRKDFDGSYRRLHSSLTAVFTDDFETHGRMYTRGHDGYQSCRKHERGRFFIDSQLCVECDYKCHHPRIAYNSLGLGCPDDCYKFLGNGRAARLLAKKILNTAFNAASLNEASGSFIKAIQSHNHDRGTRAYRQARTLRWAWKALGKPRPKRLFAAARTHHTLIKQYFFRDAGVKFMRHDSDIAIRVMHNLVVQCIPVACFHDSFLVPKEHEVALRDHMDRTYFDKFGFHPRVD